MNKILFSTGNQRKIKEARAACELFNIEVVPVSYEFNEIQSHDPLVISKQKVEDAYKLAGESAIVVADTSWSFPALNGFPGGYMKDVAEWFAPEDFINLMASKEDKSIIFRESIVYKDANEIKVFSKEYKGSISDYPRGNDGNAIDKVALFNGRTLAESHDLGETSHNPEDFIWYEFAKWFSKKP
jgi:non-canonical purine NTP pyrophosphatase (RdgB/HAM1 family)